MAKYKYQNINVNIIDVDTKKVILEDFHLEISPLSLRWLIRGGSDMMCSVTPNIIADYYEAIIPEMGELGYEWAYPDGNIINPEIEYDGNGSSNITLPGLFNFYLRKV